MNYPHPKNHIIIKQAVSVASESIIIPVLYLNTNGKTKRVEVLVEYFLDNVGRSEQWMRYRARAMGLFFDYCTSLTEVSSLLTNPLFHKKLIRGFLYSLLNGTVDRNTGHDRLKLYWPSSSIDIVKRICSALRDIINYCDENDFIDSNILMKEAYSIPKSDQATLSFLLVAHKIKRVSFLSHLVNVEHLAKRLKTNSNSSKFHLESATNKSNTAPRRFPEEMIGPLLNYGFVKNEAAVKLEDREDIVGKMCCLLWLFGGLRRDEPLHLWVNDVVYVNGHGLKAVQRHPSDSPTYIAGENISRKEYLKRIGRLPRNKERVKSRKASWKNLALGRDDQSYVYFIHKGAEELFISMYNYYISKVRPERMDVLKKNGKPEHPFLFVSSGVDRNSGKSYVGEPYSSKSINDSFNTALDRVSKKLGIEIVRGKQGNTNIHAARHFYIGKLKDAGIAPKIVQMTVKHGSIESQNAYDAPTTERIQSVMNDMQLELKDKGKLNW